MYKETAKLILYRSFGDHSILSELSKIFHDFDAKTAEDAKLIERIYTQIKALLDLATSYGFDENLWHNYLTFLLLMNENSFSLVSEKSPVQDGSVHHFAKNDFRVVKRLFDFDFHPIEKALGIDCFSTISNYKAVAKKERMYNRNVSAMVQRISRSIETAADEEEIFQIITTFYQEGGNADFDSGIKEWINANADAKTNNGGNDMVSAVTVMGYDAYFTALEAIKAAGSTAPADILAALPGVTYSGISGEISFDDIGDAKRDAAYIKTANTETGAWDFVKIQGID